MKLIILPSPPELEQVFNSIGDITDDKKAVLFSELGKRVIEHSDEIKRVLGIGEDDGKESEAKE